MKYYIGIDLGGTFIKGGVVSEKGDVLSSNKIPTEVEKGPLAIVANIVKLSNLVLSEAGMTKDCVEGIGMGVPGIVNSGAGVVTYSCNLGFSDFEIAKEVSLAANLPVKVANDANVAALGETKFGVGKKYRNTVMLTLGTGVGGGVILDGKLVEGYRGAGAELGHSVIVSGGEPCSCGRRGCLEAYASATALIRDTKRAMLANKNSKMWQIGDIELVSGKTPFDYYDEDADAENVVDNYIEKLACGIVNFANSVRPEAIILGGGVCAEGERLIKPLKKILDAELYGGELGPAVELLTAELGNNAGTLGAAALLMD